MPGETYKFTFTLHAPMETGIYDEHFNLVEEGVAWFSDPGQGGPPDPQLEGLFEVIPSSTMGAGGSGQGGAGAGVGAGGAGGSTGAWGEGPPPSPDPDVQVSCAVAFGETNGGRVEALGILGLLGVLACARRRRTIFQS
jgi:hypothetical protein